MRLKFAVDGCLIELERPSDRAIEFFEAGESIGWTSLRAYTHDPKSVFPGPSFVPSPATGPDLFKAFVAHCRLRKEATRNPRWHDPREAPGAIVLRYLSDTGWAILPDEKVVGARVDELLSKRKAGEISIPMPGGVVAKVSVRFEQA